jgi:hypothetical protein
MIGMGFRGSEVQILSPRPIKHFKNKDFRITINYKKSVFQKVH